MCGRYTLTCPPDDLVAEFGVEVPDGMEPRYNIAPTQAVPIIGRAESGAKRIALVRWGLVPPWAKSPREVKHTINARAETLLLRSAFRDAFVNRRCLVVADGFYEWRRENGNRQPFHIRRRDGRPFAFAGIWEQWQPAGEEQLFSCAIVTTAPSPLIAPVHDRMPAILGPAARDAWLDPSADPVELAGTLGPVNGNELEIYAVSPLVNNVNNDVPACLAPA
jgi:putative SOS response-associated peptidase YedK